MKNFYSILKTKTGLIIAGALLLCSPVINAQSNVKSADEIEDIVEKVSKQIGQGVMATKGISKQEMKNLDQYFAETIVTDKGQMFRNIQDDSINTNNTAAYVTIMVAKYAALYDQYKLIPANERNVSHHANTAIDPPWPGACNAGCTNTNFENGTLSGWMACYSNNTSSSSVGFSYATPTCSGILGAVTSAAVYPSTGLPQVVITNAASGNDPVCGAFIPQLCPLPGAGNYSVEIGDYNNPNYGVGILEQSFVVSKANCDFTYWYAVVLESPGGSHTHFQQPYFNVYMYDQNGNIIPFCGNYEVTADSAAARGGFKGYICNCSNGDTAYCHPWTAVFVPLKKYIGQCVTIKVVSSDCALGGHYGYGYFDASCSPLGLITSSPAICGNPITISAPPGGAAYAWTGPAGCIVGNPNQQTITVKCPGKYTVVIQNVINASCADTLDTTIISAVGTIPASNFKSDTVCVGTGTKFTNLVPPADTSGVTFEWNFGDPGSGANDSTSIYNPTHTYPTSGNYTATLTVKTACGDRDTTFKVVVNPGPISTWTATTVCLNNPTTFTNTSTGSTVYKWNFGEPSSGPNNTSTATNPTHTYSACGKYLAWLAVGTAPCIDTLKDSVTVNPLPTPAFTASPVCVGSSTILTDGSTIGCGGTITGWAWNFGDPASGVNNLSNVQDPTHIFSGVGTYNVLLTPTSNNGCQSSVTLPITIVPAPVANFVSGPVCLGQATTFTDKSTGAPTTWNWSFGDPAHGTSNVQNPSYTYATAGTYTVKLVVSSGAGCVDSTTLNVVVNPPPTAAYTASTVCQGTATVFTDGSTGAATWSWNFGDPASGANNTSTLQNPTHIFSAAGVFNVTEVVATAGGCKDSVTNPVTVNPSPTGTATVPPVCLGTASSFTCNTTMVGGTFAWAFGDPANGTSAAQNPTYTYAGNGSFNVTVVLTSANNCTATLTTTAVVNPIPVANFKNTTECLGHATSFTDQSTVAAPSTIAAWLWNFGDGTTSTVQNPLHSYAACGPYNVKLTVTSSAGCVHDTTIGITVNPMPAPSFTGTNVCQGLTSTFTDMSTIGCAGTITGWTWNFGDGGSSTLQNPTHTYATAGVWPVTLTVASNNNCDTSVTIPVTVYPLPVPAFTENSPCQGNATNFTDQSTVPGGGAIATWAWRFGDPANGTSNVQNPSYTYAAAGTYNVTLVVTTIHGCVDSITKQITVYPNPVPNFVADKKQGCITLCVQFTDSSIVAAPSNINGWLWNFGDGSSDSSSIQQNPKHCYTKVGVFTVTLTVTTNNGCTETFTRVNYITTWPIPVAKFNASPNPTTDANPTINFVDQSTGSPVSWFWSTFGDRTDSTALTQNSQHTYLYTGNYQDTGTYDVQLVIVNKYGCKDSIIEPVVITPMWTFYVPNAFSPNGDGLNDGFIGKGVGIIKYEMWIFDRWGMLLYHCTDMEHPWDGTVQGTSGKECQEDTYVWLIDITDIFKNPHRYVGRVTIVK